MFITTRVHVIMIRCSECQVKLNGDPGHFLHVLTDLVQLDDSSDTQCMSVIVLQQEHHELNYNIICLNFYSL